MWSRFMRSAHVFSLVRFFMRICGPMVVPAIVTSRSAPNYMIEHGLQVCSDASGASLDDNGQLDDDAAKMQRVFDWAPSEEREKDISAELREAVQTGQLSASDIEKKIAEMGAARTARNFKVSDVLRAELTGAGILIGAGR